MVNQSKNKAVPVITLSMGEMELADLEGMRGFFKKEKKNHFYCSELMIHYNDKMSTILTCICCLLLLNIIIITGFFYLPVVTNTHKKTRIRITFNLSHQVFMTSPQMHLLDVPKRSFVLTVPQNVKQRRQWHLECTSLCLSSLTATVRMHVYITSDPVLCDAAVAAAEHEHRAIYK